MAMVGFVPCRNKHRAKAASWQCFAYNLTLTRDVRSASVLHLMLVRGGQSSARRVTLVTDGAHGVRPLPALYRQRGQRRRASAISSARRLK